MPRTVRLSSLAWTIPAVTAALVVAHSSGGALRSMPPCSLRVLRVRAVGQADVPFIDGNRFLREPDNANRVPGPDSSWFVVRSTAQHTPAIYLEDHHTGMSELLLDRASGPRVSPDGSRLACIIWRSIQRPWTLVLLELKSRRLIEPALDGCASPYAWSPDGKWLVVMVTPCQSATSRLALVAVPSGHVAWVDSLSVFADYEFAWSRDSRLLALIRPTAIDRDTEEPTATELWILAEGGKRRCFLPTTPGYVMSEPKWVSDSAIRIKRSRHTGGSERVVIQIGEDTRP